MIAESARPVSSVMRCAAASVSRMTCGRGRGFSLDEGVGDAGVISVIYSFLAGTSMRPSPHIEDEARLIAHPVRRPRGFPDQIDVYDADAGHARDRVLDHRRQFAGRRAIR